MTKALVSVLFIVLLVLESCAMLCLTQSPPVTDQTLQQIAASLQMFVDPVPQIPSLLGYSKGRHGEPKGPGRLTIGMYQTTWKFHRDFPPTPVFAYGTSQAEATVPGPVINAVHRVPTYVTWENHLPKNHILPWDPTISTAIPKSGGVPAVVHLHGGIMSPANDGSALAWFTANFAEKGPKWSQSTYMYPNVQNPGNLWYHDHALGLTRVNLLAGLIAPYTIRDPEQEARLNLPSGPEFDRNLFIFDRSFYADGSLYINRTGNAPEVHPQWRPEYFGHAIVVNGKAWPFMNVQRRKYRFRITNASNARYLNLAMTNGLSFTVVGSDGSYLPSPVTSSGILLSTAETFDVVIDFSLTSASESIITNDAPYPFPTGSAVDRLSSQVMKFVIQGPPPRPDTSRIPPSLQAQQSAVAAAQKASVKRYIALFEYTNSANEPTHLYINGKRFTDPATETPKTGSTEVWEVINLTGDNHPLHLHIAEFQAIQSQSLNDPNGAFANCMHANSDALACNISSYATGTITQTPAYERTWKNIVKLAPGEVTTVVVKFNLVHNDEPYPFDATADPGYVYHCHILDHEDNEMIRPLMLQR